MESEPETTEARIKLKKNKREIQGSKRANKIPNNKFLKERNGRKGTKVQLVKPVIESDSLIDVNSKTILMLDNYFFIHHVYCSCL